MDLRLLRRRRGHRCPLCRDELDLSVTAVLCPDCGTGYHVSCAQELGGCSTLGCTQRGVSLVAAALLRSKPGAAPRGGRDGLLWALSGWAGRQRIGAEALRLPADGGLTGRWLWATLASGLGGLAVMGLAASPLVGLLGLVSAFVFPALFLYLLGRTDEHYVFDFAASEVRYTREFLGRRSVRRVAAFGALRGIGVEGHRSPLDVDAPWAHHVVAILPDGSRASLSGADGDYAKVRALAERVAAELQLPLWAGHPAGGLQLERGPGEGIAAPRRFAHRGLVLGALWTLGAAAAIAVMAWKLYLAGL